MKNGFIRDNLCEIMVKISDKLTKCFVDVIIHIVFNFDCGLTHAWLVAIIYPCHGFNAGLDNFDKNGDVLD